MTSRMSIRSIILAAALTSIVTPAAAQTAPPASAVPPAVSTPSDSAAPAEVPKVSEVDALKLEVAAKNLRIAMLETEKAQLAFQAIWRALQRPGLVLDAETLTYSKAPAQEPTSNPSPPPAPKGGGGGGL